MILLDTRNEETIYQSLSNILKVRKEYIDYFILKNMFEIKKDSVKDINVSNFFEFLSSYSSEEIATDLKFTHITISHLSPRLNLKSITDEPLYNLSNALINNTELSSFLNNEGLICTTHKDIVNVIHNVSKVNWKDYDSSTSQIIINRLEGNSVWSTRDNSINGFLFHGKIYENKNVRHILRIPEILYNMLTVLGKQKAITEYVKKSTPYIISFKIPVADIMFDEDGYEKLNNKQKKLHILRYCLYYLSLKKRLEWSEYDNPIVRLKDNLNLDKDKIIGLYTVNIADDLLKIR